MLKKMIKDRNVITFISIIINILCSIIGLLAVVSIFAQLTFLDFSEMTDSFVTEEMLLAGTSALTLNMGYVTLIILFILSTILSLVGYIKNDSSFSLTSLILMGVISVLYLAVGIPSQDYGVIVITISYILMIVGYVKEHKTKKRHKLL